MQAYRSSKSTHSGLAFVVAMHLVVFYAAWSGTGRSVIEKIRPAMAAVTFVDVKPPEPAPKVLPPTPMVSAPKVTMPVPDVVIDTPPEAPRITVPATADVVPAATVIANATPQAGVPDGVPVRKEFKPAYRVEPTYPKQAQRDGVTGSVLVRLHVAASGMVSRVEIVSSVNRVLEREVIRALSQWRFNPEPVGFIGEYEIAFRLQD